MSEKDRLRKLLLDLSHYYRQETEGMTPPSSTPWPPPPEMTPWPPDLEMANVRIATPEEEQYLDYPFTQEWRGGPSPLIWERRNADGTIDYQPRQRFTGLPFPINPILGWQGEEEYYRAPEEAQWPIIVRKQGRRQD